MLARFKVIKNRSSLLFLNLFAALFFMAILRFFLWQNNSHLFSELTSYQLILGLLDGSRFDLSILLLLTGILFLLNLLTLLWRFPCFLINFLFIILFSLFFPLLIADYFFFLESHFHLTNQLFLIGDDWQFIFEMASQYWWALLLYFILMVGWIIGFTVVFKNTANRTTDGNTKKSWHYNFFVLFATLAMLYFGINGKFGIKIDRMISTSDAFSQGSVAYGNLVLNGGFTTFQVWRESRKKDRSKHFSSEEARRLAHSYLATPDRKQHSNYPLVFVQHGFHSPAMPSNSNVMIIMLESWSSKFIGSFSESGSQLAITPHFDGLAAKSLRFSNIYPNGSMSLFGASAILTSIPPFSRLPILGKGAEVYQLMRPGELFRKNGYHTFAAQSAIRVSFRLNSIAKYLGFIDYFGKEDFDKLYSLESPTNGWDGETFNFLKKYLPTLDKPFFGFIFTGTTHIPYQVPDDSFKRFAHHDRELSGFYNTLIYSDQMLGEFMQWCEKQKWFDKTLFVFVADHTLDRSVLGLEAKIPLLFYAPKWIAAGQNDVLGSQIDIMPTIFSLLRMKLPYVGVGADLFDPQFVRVVLSESSSRANLIYPDGTYLSHDLKKKVFSTIGDDAREKAAEERLLSVEQLLLESVESNILYP